MPKVTFITTDGDQVAETEPNKKLTSVADNNTIEVRQACGGNGTCSTCMVQVVAGSENLSPMTQAEKDMMLPEDGSIRLSCQARAKGDVTVELMM